MQPSKKNSRKKRQRNAAGAQTGEQSNWVNTSTKMRSFPDRMITTLTFFEAPAPALTGISHWGIRYRATSPFDPSFAGSGQAKGFAEFASIYASYRVLRSTIRVYRVAKTTDSGTLLIAVPLNADPGSLPTSATVISWPQLPYAQIRVGGSGGAPASEIKMTMTTAKMFGSEMVNTDDNFAALTSTDPVNNFFWGIGLYGNLIYATDGGLMYVFIDYDVQFYDRKILS